MNTDQLAGNWKQISGDIKKKWGQLTDDDFAVANGNMDILTGKLQERYGIAREEAEHRLAEFRRENDEPAENEVAIEGDPVTTEDLKIGFKG